MKVNNIFYSLQGEGIYRGLPMTFIRLQGCNLNPRCQYCDSLYASNLRNGEDLSLLEVIKSIEEAGPLPLGWVCITGGEHLWQLSELEELVIYKSAVVNDRVGIDFATNHPKYNAREIIVG